MASICSIASPFQDPEHPALKAFNSSQWYELTTSYRMSPTQIAPHYTFNYTIIWIAQTHMNCAVSQCVGKSLTLTSRPLGRAAGRLLAINNCKRANHEPWERTKPWERTMLWYVYLISVNFTLVIVLCVELMFFNRAMICMREATFLEFWLSTCRKRRNWRKLKDHTVTRCNRTMVMSCICLQL